MNESETQCYIKNCYEKLKQQQKNLEALPKPNLIFHNSFFQKHHSRLLSDIQDNEVRSYPSHKYTLDFLLLDLLLELIDEDIKLKKRCQQIEDPLLQKLIRLEDLYRLDATFNN